MIPTNWYFKSLRPVYLKCLFFYQESTLRPRLVYIFSYFLKNTIYLKDEINVKCTTYKSPFCTNKKSMLVHRFFLSVQNINKWEGVKLPQIFLTRFVHSPFKKIKFNQLGVKFDFWYWLRMRLTRMARLLEYCPLK